MAVAFSHDGKTLASGSQDLTLKLWSVATGELLHDLAGYTGAESGVAFSPDGQTLGAAMWGGKIFLWDVNTGRHKPHIAADRERILHSIAFAPDGKTLASGGSDGAIKLWSCADDGKYREVGALYGHVAPVTSLVFCDR